MDNLGHFLKIGLLSFYLCASLGWAGVYLPTPSPVISGAIDMYSSFLTSYSEEGKKQISYAKRASAFRAIEQILTESLSESQPMGNSVVPTEEGSHTYIPLTEHILQRWPGIVEKNRDLLNEEELKDIEKRWNDTQIPNKEIITKTLPFMGTERGFHLLNEMGDVYLERGDLIEALKLLNLLKNNSPVLKTLSDIDRKKFFKKINFISQKLKDISTSDIEELLKTKGEVTSSAQKAAEDTSALCPDLKSEPSLKGFVQLSSSLALSDHIYVVVRDEYQELYLLTLDRTTRKLLQKQLIGSKGGGSWLYPFQGAFPYKLLFKNGKIILLTEEAFNEFSLDGRLAQVTDLSDRGKEAKSRELFHRYMIEVYGQDYEELALRITTSNYVPTARTAYHSIRQKEIIPWIFNAISKGYNYDIYTELLEQAGGISEEQLIEMMKDPNDRMFSFARGHLKNKGQTAVPFLLPFLKGKDDDLKIKAIDILEDIKDPRVIPGLLPLLDDKNSFVQGKAFWGLYELKAQEAKPKFRELVKDKNEDINIRGFSIAALVQMKDQESIPLFLELTKDKDKKIRAYALYALGVLKAEGSFPKLLAVVKDQGEDAEVRSGAIEALGEIGDPAAGTVLMEALSDNNSDVVGAALNALGTMHYEAALPKIKEILKDNTKSQEVRDAASDGLAMMDTPEALAVLLEIYEAEKGQIQGDIRSAIANYLKSEATIPMLLDILRDKNKDSDLRLSAVSALSRIGTPAALNAVIEAFFVEDAKFRDNLQSWRIVREDEEFKEQRERLVPKLVAMVKDPELPKLAKEKAIEMLEKIKELKPEREAALIAALEDDDAEIRAKAAFALGNMRAQSASAALVKHLSDGQMNLAVEYALYKIGTPGVEALIAAQKKALKDKTLSQDHRRGILESLIKTEDEKAIQAAIENLGDLKTVHWEWFQSFIGVQNSVVINYLVTVATDPKYDDRTHGYAMAGLRESNRTLIQQELIKKLEDPSPQVKNLALKALKELQIAGAVPQLHQILKNPASEKKLKENSALVIAKISRNSAESIDSSVAADVAPVLRDVILEGVSPQGRGFFIPSPGVKEAVGFFSGLREEESVREFLNSSPELRQKLIQVRNYLTDHLHVGPYNSVGDNEILTELEQLLGGT